MLQVKNLLCARNDRILFNRLNFELNSGQALQIIGANGSGKTTLLKTIAGFLSPFSGSVVIDKSDICYVGHKSGLHPDLTVWENSQFLQTFLPKVSDRSKDALLLALEYFQMREHREARLGQLSAGISQKLSLVRLYLSRALVWILDEPLANLDAGARQLLSALCIKHINQHGIIIYASHNAFALTEESNQTLTLENYG